MHVALLGTAPESSELLASCPMGFAMHISSICGLIQVSADKGLRRRCLAVYVASFQDNIFIFNLMWIRLISIAVLDLSNNHWV